jgi:hypothetical protein
MGILKYYGFVSNLLPIKDNVYRTYSKAHIAKTCFVFALWCQVYAGFGRKEIDK